jgi:Na+/H+ antiporter NhaA
MRGAMIFLAMAVATPAFANSGTAIPEPSDIGLFALAVAGLILGRSISKRPPADPDA